jgi:hypothetical protein
MKHFLLPLVAVFSCTILDAKNPFEADYDKSVFIRSLIRQTGIQTPASLKYVDAYEKTKKQSSNPRIKETLATIFELFYKQNKRPPLSISDIQKAKSTAKKKDLTPESAPQQEQFKNVPKTPGPLDVPVPSSQTSRENDMGFAAIPKNSDPDFSSDLNGPKSPLRHFSFDDEEALNGIDIRDYPKMPEKPKQHAEMLERINRIQEELNNVKREITNE